MGKRRKAREEALKRLYMLEFNQLPPNKTFFLSLKAEEGGEDDKSKVFMERLVEGVIENKTVIDNLIKETSYNWRIDRMAVVDRNIIRIATFEMLKMKDIPFKVSLNEAIELGKRYGSEDSPSFINGILDKISSNLKRK